MDADIEVAETESARRTPQRGAATGELQSGMKLTLHITTSRRILNDLRTLRRLLLAEREGAPVRNRVAGAGAD